MLTTKTTRIRVGILALPVYGLLTFWSTLGPQPNQSKDIPRTIPPSSGSTFRATSGPPINSASTSILPPRRALLGQGITKLSTEGGDPCE